MCLRVKFILGLTLIPILTLFPKSFLEINDFSLVEITAVSQISNSYAQPLNLPLIAESYVGNGYRRRRARFDEIISQSELSDRHSKVT